MAFNLLRNRATLIRQQLPVLRVRTFATTQIQRLKEDADRSPEHIEQKKHESVNKAKKGEGEWHEGLASSGESNVKADKQDVEDHDKHMEDLQKHTAQKGEEGKL